MIARTPRTCLNIWAGDHRQTPGGLKNTVECRMFRQKLLQRPLALRRGTEYVQPHELHQIASQYLDGPCDSPSHKLKLLLDDPEEPMNSMHITAVTQLWCEILDDQNVWLDTSVCATCFAILWLALKGEGVSTPVADSLDAAAGLARRQRWGLIIPSSARVSRLTYQTVIGVRYPELVKHTLKVGAMGDMSLLKLRCRVASFLSFGMCQRATCTRLVTSVPWWSGCRIISPLDLTRPITLRCSTTKTIYGARVWYECAGLTVQ